MKALLLCITLLGCQNTDNEDSIKPYSSPTETTLIMKSDYKLPKGWSVQFNSKMGRYRFCFPSGVCSGPDYLTKREAIIGAYEQKNYGEKIKDENWEKNRDKFAFTSDANKYMGKCFTWLMFDMPKACQLIYDLKCRNNNE